MYVYDRHLAGGEARYTFAKRLTRAQVRQFVSIAKEAGAGHVSMDAARRSALTFGYTKQNLEATVAEIVQCCAETDFWSPSVRFNDGRPVPSYHQVYHFSPKPSSDRLGEITDRVGEIPGIEKCLWRASNDMDEAACIFVHVYFKHNIDDADLVRAKQLVELVLGTPFDRSLIAP